MIFGSIFVYSIDAHLYYSPACLISWYWSILLISQFVRSLANILWTCNRREISLLLFDSFLCQLSAILHSPRHSFNSLVNFLLLSVILFYLSGCRITKFSALFHFFRFLLSVAISLVSFYFWFCQWLFTFSHIFLGLYLFHFLNILAYKTAFGNLLYSILHTWP